MKKYLLLLLLLTITGCSVTPPTPSNAPEILVYRGEYVVQAKGKWCPWTAGTSSCTKVLGKGSWQVNDFGQVKLIKPELATESIPVPYNEEEDYCNSKEMEGYECSPNYVLSINSPDDPLLSNLWGLSGEEGAQVTKAWNVVKESTVKVAVIDSGVNCSHPDINCSKQFDAITGANEQEDTNGHGTHVAGTICATGNNGIGIVGVAWKCDLIAIKFLGANGSGSTFDAIRGIDFAIQEGVQVINASWGGGGFSRPLRAAIERARARGIMFVAAAGNRGLDNDTYPHYPSNYDSDNIISVAATDQAGRKADFSNYGKKSVDLAAPGVGIVSAYVGGRSYNSLSGTSMAAPHVTGTIALIKTRSPGLNVAGVRSQLFNTVRIKQALRGRVGTGGILDAYRGVLGRVCRESDRRKCVEQCSREHRCDFRKQKRCRAKCRRETSCEKRRKRCESN